MKDYVRENQRILDDWGAKFIKDKECDEAYNGYNAADYFAQDGIMNKGSFYIDSERDNACFREPSNDGRENKLWSQAPLRVLFLSKDENGYGGTAWDVRSETFHIKGLELPIKDYQISGSFFFQNEACLLYCLLNASLNSQIADITSFSWEDAVRFSDNEIFARINCKKEVGESTCQNWVLQEAIEKYDTFLGKQIKNLDADVMICCGRSKQIGGTQNLILNYLNSIGYDFEKIGGECGDELFFDKRNNKVALNIYHLSYFRYNYIKTIEAYYKFIQLHPEFINSHRK